MVFFFLNIEGWKVAAEQQLLALELEILRQVHYWLHVVFVVYHETIVVVGHELLKIFWPMVIGCVPSTAGSSLI